MENEIDYIDNLEVSSHDLNEIIVKKLNSFRNKLEISFIGKISTPKNLFIKQLTNIDIPSFDEAETNHYYTVIYKYTETSEDIRIFHNDKNQDENKIVQDCEKNVKEITREMMTNGNLGSYLKENKHINRFEIYLPQSENSVLNQYIIYNNPQIGYSDELDKFVVEQCYKSCYLYVFVVNAEESILEEEMNIISLLTKKRKVIVLQFVTAYSGCMNKEDYTKIEQYYANKIKEIAKFPGIIIISGHGYMSYGQVSQINSAIADAVPEENRIKDLGKFIRDNYPTEEMIRAAVKIHIIKRNLSNKSKFVESNENIESELKRCVENIANISNFISKSVKSNELKGQILKFNKAIRSILFNNNYGSNYLIFGNSQINSFDILQALIELPIVNKENLMVNISIIKCNLNPTIHEYFVLQNDNKKYDISELNNLSKIISHLEKSSNENISIELYLDNEIHPIIQDEMKIIYHNDFHITNEELLSKYKDYEIAVILDDKSYNDENIIKYLQSKHLQFYILISLDEWIANDRCPEKIKEKSKIINGKVEHVHDFYFLISKILSNLKYRKITKEIILLIQQFSSHLDEPINFDVNIKDISDWQFHQLNDDINSKIKSIKNEEFQQISTIAEKEVIKFIIKMIKENLNDDILLLDIKDEDIIFSTKIKETIDGFIDASKPGGWMRFKNYIKNNYSYAKCFLNHYADKRDEFTEEIKNIYHPNVNRILSNHEIKLLKDRIDHLESVAGNHILVDYRPKQ